VGASTSVSSSSRLVPWCSSAAGPAASIASAGLDPYGAITAGAWQDVKVKFVVGQPGGVRSGGIKRKDGICGQMETEMEKGL
jgi:hypothetical protein